MKDPAAERRAVNRPLVPVPLEFNSPVRLSHSEILPWDGWLLSFFSDKVDDYGCPLSACRKEARGGRLHDAIVASFCSRKKMRERTRLDTSGVESADQSHICEVRIRNPQDSRIRVQLHSDPHKAHNSSSLWRVQRSHETLVASGCLVDAEPLSPILKVRVDSHSDEEEGVSSIAPSLI